jgi:hypothetical protein
MIDKAMNTTKDKITDAQRRKLFYFFNEVGFDDEARHDMVLEWTKGRTASLSGLSFIEAQQMIRQMDERLRKPQQRESRSELDRKRKGVLKAIFAYLANAGIEADIDYVKAVAIRASGMAVTGHIDHDFNRISEAALTRIYNEFCAKQQVQAIKNRIPMISKN